jgi:uncharacterized protein YgbK (DUF1537 family)
MIGVIADDLSGAAELAAVGWRHGLRAEILLNGRCDATADLVCVDTHSRGCDNAESAARARGAARALREAGAAWIYKKVDSVLRGQVTAEVQAIMSELNLPQALLVPVNPSLGRIIRGGNYFVRGKLLHETEFAHDPQHPRTSSAVNELLNLHATQMRKLGEPLTESGILVGEAETADDLRAWASQVNENILPAGAAEFFGALLAVKGLRKAVEPRESSREEKRRAELFVCGSTSESSRIFCEAAAQSGAAIFSLPEKLIAGAPFDLADLEPIAAGAIHALKNKRRVILKIGLPLVRDIAIARSLAENLVRLAERVLAASSVDNVYAEGGETAAALARRLGWGRLAIERELALGVVSTLVDSPRNVHFTLKPGSYEWPECVRKVI